MEAFGAHYPGATLPELLRRYAAEVHVGGPFFLCQYADLLKARRRLAQLCRSCRAP